MAWNAVARDSTFLRSNGWVDSVGTRLGGQRFRVRSTPNSIGQLDSVGVLHNAGATGSIVFADRHYGWNREVGGLDTIVVFGQTTRVVHNKDGLPVQTLWAAVTRTDEWTAIHRPAKQSFTIAPVDTAFFRQYSYDGRFNLRDYEKREGGNLWSRQRSYDGLRRLGDVGSTLFAPASCPFDVANGYVCTPLTFDTKGAYEAAGNRLAGAGDAYGPGNRVQSFGGVTFGHDLDGNLTGKAATEQRAYEWSAEGLLTRVLVNGVERVRYDYDAHGQLTRRATNGVVDRYYLWDQDHLLAELDATATQRIAEYAYQPGADRPFALVTGGTAVAAVRYHVLDEVGNVIGLLGPQGAGVDQQVAYDDWGVATVSGSADNRLLFKGLLWEPDAGLYYMRARWYDPQTGRFLSEDRMGIKKGLKFYIFGANDPINRSDPSGCFSIGRGIIGAISGFLKGGLPGAIVGGIIGGDQRRRQRWYPTIITVPHISSAATWPSGTSTRRGDRPTAVGRQSFRWP